MPPLHATKTPDPQPEIWFDGVDKKIIEIHSTKTNIVDGDDKNLLTTNPLKKKAKNNSSNGKTMRPTKNITEEVAIDCEMVECFHHKSVLARVSIVNLFGHTLLDKYVAPPSKVTDYRTRYSGIRPRDLEGAQDFDSVRQEVAKIIKDRIVVGHAIHHDFEVLKINHPPNKTRDTSQYFRYLFQGRTPSLKKLCESVLKLKIQEGEHDSVVDARATMKLYVKERDRWASRPNLLHVTKAKRKH